MRQFFFAVGKPHRPMDAKLTGEEAGRVEFLAMSDAFQNWTPLRSASLGHFPRCGQCAVVYAFRDSRDGEILKYGKTGCARDRIFKNYIGGNGGSTTRRIHDNLFTNGMIEHDEIAWIETSDSAQAELKEKRFRAEFVRIHGHWPLWDLKD